MPQLTLRGLEGPHVIEASNTESDYKDSIVTLKNSPTITLPEGTYELDIYICKSRSFNKRTGEDVYIKGKIFSIYKPNCNYNYAYGY